MKNLKFLTLREWQATDINIIKEKQLCKHGDYILFMDEDLSYKAQVEHLEYILKMEGNINIIVSCPLLMDVFADKTWTDKYSEPNIFISIAPGHDFKISAATDKKLHPANKLSHMYVNGAFDLGGKK